MSKFCIMCGKELDDSMKFCNVCGAAQGTTKAVGDTENKMVDTIPDEIKNKKTFIVCSIIAGVIVLTVLGVIFFMSKSKLKQEEESNDKKRQEADVEYGIALAKVIEIALCDEEIYEEMSSYDGQIISWNDLEYLPELKSEIEQTIRTNGKIRYKKDGATGYVFKLVNIRSGDIEVYISSETKIDEWMVYPEVDQDYYKGIKDDV